MAAKDGNWIEGMNGGKGPKKGALHKALGIPEGSKIPKAKVTKAAAKGGTIGKEAKLAQTLGKLRKKK